MLWNHKWSYGIFIVRVRVYIYILIDKLQQGSLALPEVAENPLYNPVRGFLEYEVNYRGREVIPVPVRRPQEVCDFVWPIWTAEKVAILAFERYSVKERRPEHVANTLASTGVLPMGWQWPSIGWCLRPTQEDRDKNQFKVTCEDNFWAQKGETMPNEERLIIDWFLVKCEAPLKAYYRDFTEDEQEHPMGGWYRTYRRGEGRFMRHCFCGPSIPRPQLVKPMTSDCVGVQADEQGSIGSWAMGSSVHESPRLHCSSCDSSYQSSSSASDSKKRRRSHEHNHDIAWIQLKKVKSGQWKACLMNDQAEIVDLYVESRSRNIAN